VSDQFWISECTVQQYKCTVQQYKLKTYMYFNFFLLNLLHVLLLSTEYASVYYCFVMNTLAHFISSCTKLAWKGSAESRGASII
jgi:hypothetical protein